MKPIFTAIAQIRWMLSWFISHGVDRWDLALRRPDGAFVAKDSADLNEELLTEWLKWARWSNAQGTEVYIRPARGYDWPMVFLDDVEPHMALRIARQYAALVVHTSRQGGCHVWLHLVQPLNESERYLVQSYLQPLAGADPASISGEHWGRLAGTRNHKRGGQWTGVLDASNNSPYSPPPGISPPRRGRCVASSQESKPSQPHSRDESVAEFAWCCHCLRKGMIPEEIVKRLKDRATKRGKRNPDDYARRTIGAALQKT